MSRKFITPMVILLILIPFLLYDYFQRNKQVRDLQRAYPSISYDRKLNLTIKWIINPAQLRGAANHAFVVFSNSENATIQTTDELKSDALSLDDILSVGDSIVKEANSNVIFVYKPMGKDSIGKAPFTFMLWEFRNTK